MDTQPTNSSPAESTPAQTPSAPAQTQSTSPVQPAKTSVFAGAPAPAWVKSAGLEEVHNKTQTATPAPVAQPARPAQTQQVQQTQAVAPTAPVAPQQPAALPFDQKQFAQTLAEALRPPAAGQPQMTDAELRAQLNIFEADDAAYEAILGVKPDTPERVAALNRALQGVARQAVTMSQIMNQRAIKEYQDSLNPYITAIRSQEADRQKQVFFTESPDLKGFDAVVETQFQLALASGKQFPSVDAARKYVADQARAQLRAIGITPGTAQPGTTTNNPTTTSPNTSTRKMTPTSVGGRSGMSATSKPTNNVQAVWGNRK